MPFDKSQRLGKILPEDIYNILKKKGVITKLPKTVTEKRLFHSKEDDKRVLKSKKVDVELKEDLTNIVKKEVEIFRDEVSKLGKKIAKENLKTNVTNSITKFVSDKCEKYDKSSIENNIQRPIDKLVNNVDREFSRNFIENFVDKIIQFVLGRKESKYDIKLTSELTSIAQRIKKTTNEKHDVQQTTQVSSGKENERSI
ncbi:hypothetical protein SZ25_00468 [Candidatus Arcanobacter lacustris]|uniref:Uncharacterized protein n=1 Tax=Candidatus Arcanibacter lacustris TaxID=1607817 RepID=A0A0F5MP21_9RICK|nr:hypothetical protein SZ25_00468 [Candidatus Arcanobacter lacustris]